MKIKNAMLAVALGLAFTSAAGAQVIGYSPRTGDVWVDTQLGQMNDYGRNDRGYFVDDVVGSFGAPRYLVNDLLGSRNWSPGDVYYACALAYQLRRPCSDVVREYEGSRGQGWGVIAKRMGIKPGSAQFHALKGQVGKSNGKFKSHGPAKGGKDVYDNGPGNSGKHGPDIVDDAPGNSGNSGKAKGKSDGKGKDKGRN